VPVGEGLALAPALGQLPEVFTREDAVPTGTVWMMGDTRDSFDSRYWGPLPMAQIRGRAYALY
jgi:conjugal transfer pilin signal peptidase TrbI